MSCCFCYFFFNDTATTEIYTLSLHDALPISDCSGGQTEVGMVLRSGGRRLYICARRQRIFVTLWGKIFRRVRGEISSLEFERLRLSFKSYEGLKLTMNAYIEQDGKHLYSNAAYVTVNSSLTPVELILTAP